ncbi:MAG: amidohydrolase family protein [Bacteroidetes bacterium]|nr:amidohydrolase family protein [Bacteroidota bacterium]
MKFSFVDLQVNGYAGVDFSSPKLTRDDIEKVCSALLKQGTGAFLATVVSAAEEAYELVLPALAEAVRNPPDGALIFGIHLEGPFLSPMEGTRGAHPPENIRRPDTLFFQHLLHLCDGALKLITVAPEVNGIDEIIKTAAGAGIIVSSGHSMTGYKEMQKAVNQGVSLITHLGNGCPAEIHRHHNPIFAQLSSEASPMIIPDGYHLPEEFIRLVVSVTGIEKLIAVSDVSPIGGCEPGNYESFGTPVTLLPEGKLVCRDSEYLAGSFSTLIQCLNWLASKGWSQEDLWRIGRDNPSRAMNLDSEIIREAGVEWHQNRFQI